MANTRPQWVPSIVYGLLQPVQCSPSSSHLISPAIHVIQMPTCIVQWKTVKSIQNIQRCYILQQNVKDTNSLYKNQTVIICRTVCMWNIKVAASQRNILIRNLTRGIYNKSRFSHRLRCLHMLKPMPWQMRSSLKVCFTPWQVNLLLAVETTPN